MVVSVYKHKQAQASDAVAAAVGVWLQEQESCGGTSTSQLMHSHTPW